MSKSGHHISMIWAMDRNGLIGHNNRMPWKLPAEMAYFRKTTMGHPVVMGRLTYESIGKPLAGRENIVLSRNPDYAPEGVTVVRSPEEAVQLLNRKPSFVIGGAQVYRLFLPYAEKLFVTNIDHEFTGDEYFPEIDWQEWRLVSEELGETDHMNPYPFRFLQYARNI